MVISTQHIEDRFAQGRINSNEKKAAELEKLEKEKREENSKRVVIDYEFNKILKKKIEEEIKKKKEMEKKKSEDKNSDDKNSEEKDNQYNKEVIDKEFILLKLIDTGNLDDNDIRYIFLLRNTFNQSGNYEEGINKLLNDYVHKGNILNNKKDDLNFDKIMDESSNETLTPHITRLINEIIEPYKKKPEEEKPKRTLLDRVFRRKGGKRRKTSRRTRKPRRKSSRRLRRKSRRQRKR